MTERHAHYCKDCNICWAHDGDETQELSDSEYKREHTCAGCGADCRWRLPADFNPANGVPEDFKSDLTDADVQMMFAAFLLRRLQKRKLKPKETRL